MRIRAYETGFQSLGAIDSDVYSMLVVGNTTTTFSAPKGAT